MCDINDVIRQLKEEEEREEAEAKAYKELEAKLKSLQKDIKEFETEFEEQTKQNKELRITLAEKEIKRDFLQQQKNFWTEVVSKNHKKIEEQEDSLERLQQKIWNDRISFCNTVADFSNKYDLMAMYRGELFSVDEEMNGASNVESKSENQLESDSLLSNNTDLACRPHLENIATCQTNKKTETVVREKVAEVKHIREDIVDLEKQMQSVAEEAEALHKFKKFTIAKPQIQDYRLKYESPYFKKEATRIPSAILSGSSSSINENSGSSQSRYRYAGSSFQPGPSNTCKINAQKFGRTSYSISSSNNSSISTSSINNSSKNKLKDLPYENKFNPKFPSATLRNSTTNNQQQQQVFKFSQSKHFTVM